VRNWEGFRLSEKPDTVPHMSGRTINQKVEGEPLKLWEGGDGSFPKPGELIEIHGHASMTMQDRRTLNLLLTNAWPRITEDVEHVIKKSVLRGDRPGNERLSDTIDRLMKTIVEIKVTRDGKPARRKVQLLGPTDEHRDDLGNLYYRFLPELIEIITLSDHWARLQAQAMLALTSKYSQALYEMIQKRAGLTSKFREDFTIPEIRSVLGVPEGKMTRWADLYRFAIEPAEKQVATLSSCHVRIEPIKKGRLVVGVRMAWFPKDEEGLKLVYTQIEHQKTERRARKDKKKKRGMLGQGELGL
jgi:hypothetical protein